MENLIEAICTALRDDAEPIARRAGLVACRKILAVLEATTDGEPAISSAAHASTAPATPSASSGVPASAPDAVPSAPTAAVVSGPVAAPVAPAAPTLAPRIDPAAVATLVAAIGKLPPEQLLDLAIARLRAALPPDTSVPTPTPLRFQLVPLHHLKPTKP